MRTGLKALTRPQDLEVALIGAHRPVCQFVEGL
jgi:hypothetical protein